MGRHRHRHESSGSNIRTIGVSQAQGPAMYLSMEAGQPVAVVEEPSLADSLLGGIGLENHYTFSLIQMLVDEVVLVDEAEIAAAMAHALREERQIIEGGGGVGIAALLADKGSNVGRTCCCDCQRRQRRYAETIALDTIGLGRGNVIGTNGGTMNLLILGGTIFVGRHLVEAAVARGHSVTLFNRGQHNTDLFEGRRTVLLKSWLATATVSWKRCMAAVGMR
ncbi:MAG: pyridoxal-phosphate dependent enzyme [Caldilineaceae bacterium]